MKSIKYKGAIYTAAGTDIKLTNFGHDDKAGTITYKGHPIATKTRRGWHAALYVPGPEGDSIVKAVQNAIFALSNEAVASEMRKRIGEELGL